MSRACKHSAPSASSPKQLRLDSAAAYSLNVINHHTILCASCATLNTCSDTAIGACCREGRAATSQLHALRDVLARSSAQQQDMEKQLSALKARAKAAEEEAEASQARCKQLQQELTNAKGGQANNALRLLNLQTSQQLLDEKLTRTSSALAQEQAARAEADKQVGCHT